MRFDRAEDDGLLAAFAEARVADVRDGMDVLGYHFFGSVSPAIRPLWRTRAVGIARTVRYLPFRGRVPELACEEYQSWSGRYYNEICTYPWVHDLREGDFVAIDASGVDAGLMGSENTLVCLKNGARGLLTNGGVRDTDEVVHQRVPFWSAMVSKSMVQGRLQFDAHDVPVAIGGVTVVPGDVIVADGDGVIVVPREIAMDVAREANAEHARDKANRARHYESLNRALDETVL